MTESSDVSKDSQYVKVNIMRTLDTLPDDARQELSLRLPNSFFVGEDADVEVDSSRVAVTGVKVPVNNIPLTTIPIIGEDPIFKSTITYADHSLGLRLDGVMSVQDGCSFGSAPDKRMGLERPVSMAYSWFRTQKYVVQLRANARDVYANYNSTTDNANYAEAHPPASRYPVHKFYDAEEIMTSLSACATTALVGNFHMTEPSSYTTWDSAYGQTYNRTFLLGNGRMMVPPRVRFFVEADGTIGFNMTPGFCMRLEPIADVVASVDGQETSISTEDDCCAVSTPVSIPASGQASLHPSKKSTCSISTIMPYYNEEMASTNKYLWNVGYDGAIWEGLSGPPMMGGIYKRIVTNNCWHRIAQALNGQVANDRIGEYCSDWYKHSKCEDSDLFTWVTYFFFTASSKIAEMIPALPWKKVSAVQTMDQAAIMATPQTIADWATNYGEYFYVLDTTKANVTMQFPQLNYVYQAGRKPLGLGEEEEPAFDIGDYNFDKLCYNLKQVQYTFRFPTSSISRICTVSAICVRFTAPGQIHTPSTVMKQQVLDLRPDNSPDDSGFEENVCAVFCLSEEDKMNLAQGKEFAISRRYRKEDSVFCDLTNLDGTKFEFFYISNGEMTPCFFKPNSTIGLQLTFELRLR